MINYNSNLATFTCFAFASSTNTYDNICSLNIHSDNCIYIMGSRVMRRKFLDSLRLNVKGGVGGMGLPKYGGVGGKGGNVVAVAKEGLTLQTLNFQFPEKTVKAADGEDSNRKKIFGENGANKTIHVPVGIQVYDPYKRLIGSLDQDGDSVVVAEGGPGGSPQSSPAFNGAKGIQHVVTLDLKLIADVGLVGFPNAGKSTLLKAISRANPKIASYPFTTIRPNLGVMMFPDLRQIKVADLPGLIEGAHYNVGMGHKFLKHVERTKLLLLIADVSGFQLSVLHRRRSCLETILLLNKELELYKEELLDKPAVLVINKMDLPNANEMLDEISHHIHDLTNYASTLPDELRPQRIIKFDEVLAVSAKCKEEDADRVKESLRKVLDLNYEITVMQEKLDAEKGMLAQVNNKVDTRML